MNSQKAEFNHASVITNQIVAYKTFQDNDSDCDCDNNNNRKKTKTKRKCTIKAASIYFWEGSRFGHFDVAVMVHGDYLKKLIYALSSV